MDGLVGFEVVVWEWIGGGFVGVWFAGVGVILGVAWCGEGGVGCGVSGVVGGDWSGGGVVVAGGVGWWLIVGGVGWWVVDVCCCGWGWLVWWE